MKVIVPYNNKFNEARVVKTTNEQKVDDYIKSLSKD
jgi:hypothetical protein